MARFCPLASGSEGNSTYISFGSISILVDAGIPYKSICEGVTRSGGDISKISAVAITHSHTDHIYGLKTLLKKTGAPLYATRDTVEDLIRKNVLPENTEFFDIDALSVNIGDIEINRFKTSHDAEGSCGYKIISPNGSCAVCTDLGIVTGEVRQALSGCDIVLFEANHDIDMLRRGPYPAQLKIRILSDLGHLSNISSSAEIPFLLKNGTKQIILGHISRKNNTPDLALYSAISSAHTIGAKKDVDYLISAAKVGFSGVSVF